MIYDQPWAESAKCRDWPMSVFFPEEGSRREPWLWARATRICRDCPVRRECLTFALTMESGTRDRKGIPNGVWGGFTPAERHAKAFKGLSLERWVNELLEVGV